jgi:hypothetical protein
VPRVLDHCNPPTTHRYTRFVVDGSTTGYIRCKRCGYEKEG